MKPEWMGDNNNAFALLRVSGKGQEFNSSHFTQGDDIKRYAIDRGLNLVAIVPIVESAKESENRKQYAAMQMRALREGILHEINWKYDREARNLTDNERSERLVRQGKKVLHYVVDQKILWKGSPDADFLMRDYHAVQNKHYSRDLSTKVRTACRAKADSGWFPGRTPPWGYVHQKLKSENGFERRRGTVVIPGTPEKIRIVQREFELREPLSDGSVRSLKQIRKQIITEGLIPPRLVNGYHTGSIERRLTNKFYDCRFDWSGVEYPGLHERIIPKDLFWKVQETFGLKNPYRKSRGIFDGGWLRCAEPSCGCNIVYDPKEKTLKGTGERVSYKYYRCTNGRRVHRTLKGMSLTEEEIFDQFSGAVNSISITEDFARQLSEALNETQRKAQQAIAREIEGYQDAIKSLDAKNDRLFDRYDVGEIAREEYVHQKNRIRAERDHYTNVLGRANLLINDATCETAKSILELATNAESLWKMQSAQERKRFLDQLLSNQVLDGVTVRYELKKPFKTLSEMKQDSSWRRG